MEFGNDLIYKMRELNSSLEQGYQGSLDKKYIRDKLEQLGRITEIKKMNHQQTVLVGVDGSYNSYGANYPHIVWIFRALAKGTNNEQVYLHDILTPLDITFRDKIEMFSREKRISPYDAVNLYIKRKLAEIEVDAAILGIDKCDPQIVFMDGSLIRYKIECEDKWNHLKELAISKGILLVGIIEEIGTKSFGKYLDTSFYDREVLFGVINKGEAFFPDIQVKDGFATSYIRPGNDPQPIAIDCLTEQIDQQEIAISLAAQLTPENGRGIPIWIDVVDSEVRITNKAIEDLVNSFINADLKQMLLSAKRKERWY